MSSTSFQAPQNRGSDPYKLGDGRKLQSALGQGGSHGGGQGSGYGQGGHGGGHGGHGGHGGGEATGRGEGGPASIRVIVGYGFWIFLLSDIIMFAAFFAAYAVLAGNTAGGPSGGELFELPRVAWETGFLLLSSFTCGMANIASDRENRLWTELALLATGLLGLGFFALEMLEFYGMVAAGNGPDRSAFLSSFFALVGLHGLHIFAGGLWLGTMMAQVWVKGFRPTMHRRLLCFYLFWHALDIIWVAIFTFVYLIGSGI